MSEVDHYKGKLRIVAKLDNETLEEQCKRILNNQELNKFYGSYEEMLVSENYDNYVIHNNIIYSIIDKQQFDAYEDIFVANKNIDGTIDFEVKYYNGGCGFSEAIEYALENMK